MQSINPKLVIALVLVIGLAVWLTVMNPYKKYSTQEYWQSATVASVADVPDEALRPGNRNGGVLMWAASGARDPAIIAALVERGADVNEADPIFSGTPLTGAAAYTQHPVILDELVRLGADIDKRVNNNQNALMVAAQFNTNPGIVEKLVALGLDPAATDSQGRTALELAQLNQNKTAEEALAGLMAVKAE